MVDRECGNDAQQTTFPGMLVEADVLPGPVMMLDLMIGVALATEEEAGSYLKEYLRVAR